MTPADERADHAASLGPALSAALGRAVETNVALSGFSTYRLGGPAALFVDPQNLEELMLVGEVVTGQHVPILVVGRGSNLLVSDAGFPGVAVHLGGEFADLELGEDTAIGGAALALPVLARRVAAAGLAGLEFYVGIPGTVGGAVRMNAGGHGRDTAEVLLWAAVVTLGSGYREEQRSPADLEFGYRQSTLAAGDVVTRAAFRVEAGDPDACGVRIDDIVRWRREHQPGGANAGSVFTNPDGDSAGRLIDACGLKGYRVGGAVVSDKHANFFLAEERATATDVAALVAHVQARVVEETGVWLEPELTLVGFDQ